MSNLSKPYKLTLVNPNSNAKTNFTMIWTIRGSHFKNRKDRDNIDKIRIIGEPKLQFPPNEININELIYYNTIIMYYGNKNFSLDVYHNYNSTCHK